MMRQELTKWVLAIAVALLAATPSVCGALEVRIAAPDRAVCGRTIDIPLNVQGAKGLGGMTLRLVFDPAVLEFKSIEEGPLLAGALVDTKTVEPGVLRVATAGGSGLAQSDGDLLIARFDVTGQPGQTDLRLEHVRAWEFDSGGEMLVTLLPGQLTIVASTRRSLTLLLAVGGGGLAVLLVVIASVARRRSSRRSQSPD